MIDRKQHPATNISLWADHPDDFGRVFPIQQKNHSAILHYFYEFNDDPTIQAIYVGPCGGTNGWHFCTTSIEHIREHLIRITKPDTKLFFDNLLEGNLTPTLYRIYKAIEGTNIRPSQIYLFSGAVGAKEFLDQFCREYNISEKIHIYGLSTWEYDVRLRTEVKETEYEIGPKPKLFLCLNRIIRHHRLALVPLLIEKNLLDKGYFSFFPDNGYGSKHDVPRLFVTLARLISGRLYREVLEAYQKNEYRFPLKLNIEPEHGLNYVRAEDLFLFRETNFSLVTETYFFDMAQYDVVDEREIFFSEKAFKPIAMKHPFMLAAKPHALKWMRKLGYKTFHPFIDEAYDDIENHEQRLLAIVKETERLCAQTPEQWIEWQRNVKPIVDCNHQVMFSKEKYEYIVAE